VGIETPVRLCEVLDLTADADKGLTKKVNLFHEALAIFENRAWKEAQAAYQAVLDFAPNDNPAKLFHKRCGEYLTTPPAGDWDGVVNLSQK
jgi:hypothetical protein